MSRPKGLFDRLGPYKIDVNNLDEVLGLIDGAARSILNLVSSQRARIGLATGAEAPNKYAGESEAPNAGRFPGRDLVFGSNPITRPKKRKRMAPKTNGRLVLDRRRRKS